MNKMNKSRTLLIGFILGIVAISSVISLGGCDGLVKDVSSGFAESFGGDWVITQYSVTTGEVFACYSLQDVSVSNELNSDGINWKDGPALMSISAPYNKREVVNGDWEGAYNALGITKAKCEEVQARYKQKK
jgi:hypothetical protein